MLGSLAAVDVFARMAQPWANFYSDHTWVHTTTLFFHLAGIFLGGGFAIATDRDTFIAVRAARLSGQIRHLGRIRTIHRPVLFTFLVVAAGGAWWAASPVSYPRWIAHGLLRAVPLAAAEAAALWLFSR